MKWYCQECDWQWCEADDDPGDPPPHRVNPDTQKECYAGYTMNSLSDDEE